MALKKTLAQRLLDITRISRHAVNGGCRAAQSAVPRRRPSIELDPGDNGLFSRRFLHKGAALPPELQSLPLGDGLRERLRAMDVARGRIRLDGLIPPPAVSAAPPAEDEEEEKGSPELTAEDARKLLRVAQMETVRARLREIREMWMPYPEFVRICGEGCSDPGQGVGLAKLLDESGNVVVLGNTVLLRPDMVMKAVAGLIPLPEPGPNDPRRKELEELEKQKTAIDREADSQVRRELWAGLGFLVAQTAAFMRLTFWELSWDVMEPICFYVTSFYFMVGYAFFLRTSREPSFEGFFQSRFSAKQKRLIKSRKFDLERYEQLRRAMHPRSTPLAPPTSFHDDKTVWFGPSSVPIEMRS